MLLKILILLLGAAQAQTAPNFLIFPSLAACRARSQAMCQAMGCDGVGTVYWWACQRLNPGLVGPTAVNPGSYAIRVAPNGPYSATASDAVSGGPQGLTAQEQSQLNTAADVAPLIPPPPH